MKSSLADLLVGVSPGSSRSTRAPGWGLIEFGVGTGGPGHAANASSRNARRADAEHRVPRRPPRIAAAQVSGAIVLGHISARAGPDRPMHVIGRVRRRQAREFDLGATCAPTPAPPAPRPSACEHRRRYVRPGAASPDRRPSRWPTVWTTRPTPTVGTVRARASMYGRCRRGTSRVVAEEHRVVDVIHVVRSSGDGMVSRNSVPRPGSLRISDVPRDVAQSDP